MIERKDIDPDELSCFRTPAYATGLKARGLVHVIRRDLAKLRWKNTVIWEMKTRLYGETLADRYWRQKDAKS